ncbi:MAG: hypothetical protein AABN34_25405 [Acidobacteriota bacterium]
MTKLIKSVSLMFVIALVCSQPRISASQTAGTKSSTHTENSIRQEDHNWTWHHRDNEIDLKVTIRGKVEFADDYSDIKSISPDGSIRVSDDRGGVYRKFEASMTPSGLKRSYSINGQSTPFNDDARGWLAKVLNDTVRQGGYDARPRVQRILKQSGPSGVLAEIAQLKGDYVKRIYFDELLNQGNLDTGTAREVLRQASRVIHSDYEKAQLLIKLSDSYLGDEQARTIYLEGVNTIHSDYEKGRVLAALLKQGSLSGENLLFTIRSAHNISSDYERAQLLIKIAGAFPLDEQARAVYLEGVATIKSDYEKGRVLSAILKKGDLGRETLLFALKSASTISSDYEKAQLFIKVAAASSGDEAVRTALIDSARGIRSEYERGRVLSAVFK